MKKRIIPTFMCLCILGFTNASQATICQPELKWQWVGIIDAPANPHISRTPLVAQLNDDNGDGKINEKDVADVIVGHEYITGNPNPGAVISGLNGNTGAPILTIDSRMDIGASLTVGDIDGDGIVEIICLSADKSRLLAFEHDGTFKWQSDPIQLPPAPFNMSSLSIADSDQDGAPEIIVGNEVFDISGGLKWRGTAGSGREGAFENVHVSQALEVDPLSAGMELLAGNTLYSSTGQIIWTRSDLGDGWSTVTDFEGDGTPEVILASEPLFPGRQLTVLNGLTGVTIGNPCVGGQGKDILPIAIDLDGDCVPEVLSKWTETDLEALKWDGTDFSLYWQIAKSDLNGAGIPSVFDVNGDGYPEVMSAGQSTWIIVDGMTGQVDSSLPHSSGNMERMYVAVADLEGDGHAEFIVPTIGDNKVTVYSNTCLAPARPIWNQFAYHVTNVNDDGTIPQIEKTTWKYGLDWLAQVRDADVEHPSSVGNTLKGAKVLSDVALVWAPVGAREYLLYREMVKGIWGLPYLTLPAPSAYLVGDVGGPPLYFYQVRSRDCIGAESSSE